MAHDGKIGKIEIASLTHDVENGPCLYQFGLDRCRVGLCPLLKQLIFPDAERGGETVALSIQIHQDGETRALDVLQDDDGASALFEFKGDRGGIIVQINRILDADQFGRVLSLEIYQEATEILPMRRLLHKDEPLTFA